MTKKTSAEAKKLAALLCPENAESAKKIQAFWRHAVSEKKVQSMKDLLVFLSSVFSWNEVFRGKTHKQAKKEVYVSVHILPIVRFLRRVTLLSSDDRDTARAISTFHEELEEGTLIKKEDFSNEEKSIAEVFMSMFITRYFPEDVFDLTDGYDDLTKKLFKAAEKCTIQFNDVTSSFMKQLEHEAERPPAYPHHALKTFYVTFFLEYLPAQKQYFSYATTLNLLRTYSSLDKLFAETDLLTSIIYGCLDGSKFNEKMAKIVAETNEIMTNGSKASGELVHAPMLLEFQRKRAELISNINSTYKRMGETCTNAKECYTNQSIIRILFDPYRSFYERKRWYTQDIMKDRKQASMLFHHPSFGPYFRKDYRPTGNTNPVMAICLDVCLEIQQHNDFLNCSGLNSVFGNWQVVASLADIKTVDTCNELQAYSRTLRSIKKSPISVAHYWHPIPYTTTRSEGDEDEEQEEEDAGEDYEVVQERRISSKIRREQDQHKYEPISSSLKFLLTLKRKGQPTQDEQTANNAAANATHTLTLNKGSVDLSVWSERTGHTGYEFYMKNNDDEDASEEESSVDFWLYPCLTAKWWENHATSNHATSAQINVMRNVEYACNQNMHNLYWTLFDNPFRSPFKPEASLEGETSHAFHAWLGQHFLNGSSIKKDLSEANEIITDREEKTYRLFTNPNFQLDVFKCMRVSPCWESSVIHRFDNFAMSIFYELFAEELLIRENPCMSKWFKELSNIRLLFFRFFPSQAFHPETIDDFVPPPEVLKDMIYEHRQNPAAASATPRLTWHGAFQMLCKISRIFLEIPMFSQKKWVRETMRDILMPQLQNKIYDSLFFDYTSKEENAKVSKNVKQWIKQNVVGSVFLDQLYFPVATFKNLGYAYLDDEDTKMAGADLNPVQANMCSWKYMRYLAVVECPRKLTMIRVVLVRMYVKTLRFISRCMDILKMDEINSSLRAMVPTITATATQMFQHNLALKLSNKTTSFKVTKDWLKFSFQNMDVDQHDNEYAFAQQSPLSKVLHNQCQLIQRLANGNLHSSFLVRLLVNLIGCPMENPQYTNSMHIVEAYELISQNKEHHAMQRAKQLSQIGDCPYTVVWQEKKCFASNAEKIKPVLIPRKFYKRFPGLHFSATCSKHIPPSCTKLPEIFDRHATQDMVDASIQFRNLVFAVSVVSHLLNHASYFAGTASAIYKQHEEESREKLQKLEGYAAERDEPDHCAYMLKLSDQEIKQNIEEFYLTSLLDIAINYLNDSHAKFLNVKDLRDYISNMWAIYIRINMFENSSYLFALKTSMRNNADTSSFADNSNSSTRMLSLSRKIELNAKFYDTILNDLFVHNILGKFHAAVYHYKENEENEALLLPIYKRHHSEFPRALNAYLLDIVNLKTKNLALSLRESRIATISSMYQRYGGNSFGYKHEEDLLSFSSTINNREDRQTAVIFSRIATSCFFQRIASITELTTRFIPKHFEIYSMIFYSHIFVDLFLEQYDPIVKLAIQISEKAAQRDTEEKNIPPIPPCFPFEYKSMTKTLDPNVNPPTPLVSFDYTKPCEDENAFVQFIKIHSALTILKMQHNAHYANTSPENIIQTSYHYEDMQRLLNRAFFACVCHVQDSLAQWLDYISSLQPS